MKPRFIQTKHSGFGEWVAEVDPKALREHVINAMNEMKTNPIDATINWLIDIHAHLTTIDMSGRVGLDAKNAAEAFRKKGFTVINLKEEE